MVSDPKIVQYVEELDLLIIADGGKLHHITGDVIMGMWKAYAEGHGIDYDICEGCERVDPETTESPACESCRNQKTCKDAPIPPRYDCLGYKPEEGSRRLIDADAFKAETRELYRQAGWDLREVHYSQLDTECNIDMIPTAEAVPLEDYRSMEQTVHKLTQALAEAEPKHGRWLIYNILDYAKRPTGRKVGECSVCGQLTPDFRLITEEPNWSYCPNCGARMFDKDTDVPDKNVGKMDEVEE